ncbi:MAG TPA: NAD(P)/FAD-dependent oxidoreductase [Solirubrobacterales bacterium]
MTESYDAVVVGSGPNGLAAATTLAEAGATVLVLEAMETIGGGLRTEDLTLPGFKHDLCSAAHPLGILSPYFSSLPLDRHGLEWVQSPASVAHPLDGEPAVLAYRSLERTVDELGEDGERYRRLVAPYVERLDGFIADVLDPFGIPSHPLLLAKYGLVGLPPATLTARFFRDLRGRALFAGCAAHSLLALRKPLTSAIGLMFMLSAHGEGWPIVKGGSAALAEALAGYLRSLGGRIETGVRVTALGDLPPARAYLFDTDPRQLADIAGSALPDRYARRLRRYRYGPGAFKLDWALDGPIPWEDPRCLEAATVHLGGSAKEIVAGEAAMWKGEHSDDPWMLLVQPSQFDPTRAPEGKHSVYAYCHVPHDSTVDMTATMERQVERFAPGFRGLIRGRSAMNTADFQRHNPNYVGGAYTGGVADVPQAFARPVARLDPFSTPNARLYICSASTFPGGGVHGMCGHLAARSALRSLERHPATPLAVRPTGESG